MTRTSPADIAASDPHGLTLANCIRALAIDAVEASGSRHPGAPMGMADAATILFRDHLKFDATDPDWPDRDRVVLSNGHASMMLYALLHLTGYTDMTIDQIRNFRQIGSKTAGHPEYGHAKVIETTTGPLGQGLAAAVGMAMAERVQGDAPRIAAEAAGKFGWARYVANEDDVIGMDGFGASGPAEALYDHFGITRTAIVARARAILDERA